MPTGNGSAEQKSLPGFAGAVTPAETPKGRGKDGKAKGHDGPAKTTELERREMRQNQTHNVLPGVSGATTTVDD